MQSKTTREKEFLEKVHWSCEALSETALRDAIEVHTSDDMALKDCLP